MRMLRLAVLCSALAACAYKPGSFAHGSGPDAAFAGQRATVGCLDVAVLRRPDYDASAVLQYRFGNRCNRPIRVDLRHVAVVGRFDDGREVALAPYDPDLELRAAQLAGRLSGGESIAYPTPRPAAQICVDAASIVQAQPAQWLCFASISADGTPAPVEDAPAPADDAPAPVEDAPAPADTAISAATEATP